MAGFSINLLTLFALVLAIGTIVDDAHYCGRSRSGAIRRRLPVALQSLDKCHEWHLFGHRYVDSCIYGRIRSGVIHGWDFGSFLHPVRHYHAVAVGISAINALTLSPALCALILRPNEILVDGKKPEFSTRFRLAFDSAFKRIRIKI